MRKPRNLQTRSNRTQRKSLLGCLLVAACLVSTAEAKQENSTRKDRVKPNAITVKNGSAVRWRDSLEDALAESTQTGKPVFWYVSTLPNTFMDRKVEINRYMLCGPFAWPAIAETINQNSIPVRGVPTPEQQQKFKLNPYEFIEPGLVIIEPDQSVRFRIDRLTTLHPRWLLGLIGQQLKSESKELYSARLADAWNNFSSLQYGETIKALDSLASEEMTPEELAESGLLRGMTLFRLGQHDAADKVWQSTAESHADLPLGWKCSAEAQRIGPFSRGFEVHVNVPDAALKAGLDSAGSAAPEKVYDEAQLWDRSLSFLLGMQNANGAFYDSDYDFGGTDSLPNVHVAVTSLAGMAFLKARQRTDDPALKRRLDDALVRAFQFVTDDDNINKADRDEILWAYAYRLRFLSRLMQAKDRFPSLTLDAETLQRCVDSLQSVQSRRGSWYHEYNNPFVTGTALLALQEAKLAGGQLDPKVVQAGTKSLLNDRFANGAYPYSTSRRTNEQPLPGNPQQVVASAGRMPVCELALVRFGHFNQEALAEAVKTSLDLHNNLEQARKYDNHTSNLAYGGFFFWYDMRSRSEAIRAIEDETVRKEMAKRQRALVMSLPEMDGCFIDSHELGRVYGTAMALLSISDLPQ